ncbi:MAG: hypothetical protein HY773_01010 [Candidatus Terrybacteria bacterium]|nr:hypothetical protein [Candidatus Terrybacteria bacterium]
MKFEQPLMSSPEEMAKTEKERKKFDEASEQEQIERFLNLKSLFADKDRLENKKDINRANYFDFFNNVYKYTDKFKIEGMNDKQTAEMLEKARAGNKIIDDALDFFLEVKKNQGGEKNLMEESGSALEMTLSGARYDFADAKSYQLDVDKLIKLFDWSAKTFIKGGEVIGRKPGIREEEIKPLSEDLEAILKHVNAFR